MHTPWSWSTVLKATKNSMHRNHTMLECGRATMGVAVLRCRLSVIHWNLSVEDTLLPLRKESTQQLNKLPSALREKKIEKER